MRNFRGKRIDNGEWVYGWYVRVVKKHYIIIDDGKSIVEIKSLEAVDGELVSFVEVIPETVGQQVGLKDKNKEEIYDGDIYKRTFHYCNDIGDSVGEPIEEISVVEWKKDKGSQFVGFRFFPCDDIDNLEVIGNITDNPELLEQNNG